MNRVAALFAIDTIIALAVMSTSMARANPVPMPLAAPMMGMAMMDHGVMGVADQQPLCEQSPSMACTNCCIVMLPPMTAVPIPEASATGFRPIDVLIQIGLVVPPALPPPRA